MSSTAAPQAKGAKAGKKGGKEAGKAVLDPKGKAGKGPRLAAVSHGSYKIRAGFVLRSVCKGVFHGL